MSEQEPNAAPVIIESPKPEVIAPSQPQQQIAPPVVEEGVGTATVSTEAPAQDPQSEPVVTNPIVQQSQPVEALSDAAPSSSGNQVEHSQVQAPLTALPKKSRAKWVLPAGIFAALLIIGGTAYGYVGVYLQSPENIWKQALKNTGNAFVEYTSAPLQQYSGGKLKGTFAMSNPTTADGTMTAAYDSKNTSVTVTANAMGIRANLEVRSIIAEPAKSPDIYMKLSGIKGVGALLGDSNQIGTLLAQVDDQWYYADHTLTANATKDLPPNTNATQLQSDAQDIAKKVGTVLKDRLFTSDSNNAVVIVTKSLGKEDFKGRSSQKYSVQVRKQQLKDMVLAMQTSLKDSKAKDLIVGTSGKSFEEQTNVDQLLKEIDALSEDTLTAEVWVDLGLRYIRNVRIAMPDSKTSTNTTLDFMIDYTGGDSVPLSLTIATKDKTNDGTTTIGVTLHKNSSVVDVSLALKGVASGQKVDANVTMTLEPTNEAVNISAPAGAKNIMEIAGGVLGANTEEAPKSPLQSILDMYSL